MEKENIKNKYRQYLCNHLLTWVKSHSVLHEIHTCSKCKAVIFNYNHIVEYRGRMLEVK